LTGRPVSAAILNEERAPGIHPVYASLDHPLSSPAAERGLSLPVYFPPMCGGPVSRPLRAKAGKTMPDGAVAGVFGMLPEAADCAQMRLQASSPGFTCFAG